jgi:type IV secretion system protein VirB9
MHKSTPYSSWLLAAVIAICAPRAYAVTSATPLNGDSRLVTFNYDNDQIFKVLTRVKRHTRIEFAPDESVTAIAGGNTSTFEITKTADGKNVLIRPKFENETTSMVILTSKRTYEFELGSTGDSGKFYQRVAFEYPDVVFFDSTTKAERVERVAREEKLLEAQSGGSVASIDKLNFEYRIEGDAPFRPVQVFDDGKFTFIRLAADLQELPALFLLNEDSDPVIVNYVVKGNTLQISRLMDKMLLKLGKREVRVEKTGRRNRNSYSQSDVFIGN